MLKLQLGCICGRLTFGWDFTVQFDIQSEATQQMGSGGDDARVTDKTMMAVKA